MHLTLNFKCNNICTITAIFFADDELMMAQSVEEAEEGVKIPTEVAKEHGLELNKEKCNILIFNTKEQIESIEGINVTSKMKYVRVKVTNKRLL